MSERDEATETSAALARALSATRRAFDGESERARETERRIVESTRVTRRTRRVFWLAPLAAAFVVSAAFAGELGGRLGDLTARLFADADPVEDAPASNRASRLPGPPPAASSVALVASASPSAVPAESVPAVSSPAAPGPVTRAEPKASANVAPAPPASSSQAPSAHDELALYKAAHQAHFVAHDYESALAGWDRYLALAPRGTFALEARYNRAIALHRLGRRPEALEALRPFAEGAYGRYRRDEARALIDELR